MRGEDVMVRLQRYAVVHEYPPLDSLLLEAAEEINRLRHKVAAQRAQWFYLTLHPEHAELVAKEALGMVVTKRDQFGHVIGVEDAS